MNFEGRWFLKYALWSALAFLLHPTPLLHANGGTCPNVQNGFNDQPDFFPQSAVPAPAMQKPAPPRFASDRIIVKFKDSLSEPADLIHAAGLTFAQSTPAGGRELDQLNAKWGVRKITPVFQLEGSTVSRNTRMERKASFTRLFERSREKYARRAARASTPGAMPDLSHVYILSLPEGTDIKAACKEYSANPAVEYAAPSSIMKPQSATNDPYFSSRSSWGNSVDDMWALKRIKADVAWDTAQGDGVVVAVVDTGLDYNHVDIAPNVWSNPLEATGVAGVDDDRNGYRDDVRGWHFDFPQSYGSYVSNNDVMDTSGHGTFVAGIIAAAGNNGTGIVGVAPKARIMPVKAYSDSYGISSDVDPDSPFANAILYAAHNGADIINLSWGCSDCFNSPTIKDAITVANALGAIVVASAGDRASDVRDAFPAMIQDVITVSSTDINDDFSLYSNRGFFVDVAAPGGNSGLSVNNAPDLVSILSLASTQQLFSESSIVAPGYVRSAGTSASAAYVSGVAALVLSANPSLTREQVISIIRHSADDQVGSPAKDTLGYDPYFGWGRVNAARAVAMAASPPSDPPEMRTQPAGLSFVVPKLLCGQERKFSFDIFNIGGGTLNWSLATPPWITPATTSGTTFSTAAMTLNAATSVSGAITIAASGSPNLQFPVAVAVQPDIMLSNCSMPISAGVWDADRNVNPPGIPDGAGGAYYVSYDVLQGHPDMSVQHIDSNGNPLWGANGLRASSSLKSKYGPAITSDGFGGAIVLWIEDNNTMDQADDNLRAQRINSTGKLLWGSAGIDITQAGNVADPVIIPDGSGGAVIGWYSVAAYDPFVQRVSASGALLWGKDGIPVTRAVDAQFNLALAEDGNGGAYAVWTDRRTAWYAVYAQHISDNGVPLWEQDGKLLSLTGQRYIYGYGPNVVPDGAGGAIFAWHDTRNHALFPEDNSFNRNDIYAVRLNGEGQHLWNASGVPAVGGFTVMPARVSPSGGPNKLNMAGDGQGGAIMTWHDLRNRETTVHGKWDIYAQRLSAAGEPVWAANGIPVIAADGKQDAPTIVADGDGGALFAWHDDRSGNFDIFIQHLKADGTSRWGSPGVWVHSGNKDQVNPYMIHLGGNRLAINWNEGYYGFNGEVVQLCTDHDGDGLYAEGGVCGAVNTADPVLTVTRAGTGSGSVESLPSGISCGPDCSRKFASGTVVALKAVAAPNSQFTGWSGGGCSGTGGCAVTLGSNATVQATFTATQPVKIAENWSSIYSSPQHAYNNALNGHTIISRAHSFTQNLNLDLPVSVRLEGGYDENFASTGGYTEINGTVTISNGTATLDNIVIK